MHDAKCETDWNHTASLMALIANINRDPRKRTAPFSISDFHPMLQRVAAKPTPSDITSLKNVFLRDP